MMDEIDQSAAKSSPKRRSLLARLRPRFSLRTMLIVVTVICVLLPWVIRSERQRHIADKIEKELKGQIKLFSENDPLFPRSNKQYRTLFEPTQHSWEQHYFSSIEAVRCDEFLGKFTEWKELSRLEFLQTTVKPSFKQLKDLLNQLQQCPRLKTLRLEIEGYGNVADESLEPLEHLMHLENLQVEDKSFPKDFFFRVEKLKNLKFVDLEGNVTSRMLENLAGCAKLERLRFITLNSASFEFNSLGKFPSLKELEMITHNTDDESLKELGHLTTLEKLIIGRDIRHRETFADQSFVHFIGLKNLQELTLHNATIFDDGLSNLEHLEKLRTLRFKHCLISIKGLTELCNLTQIKVLDLSDNYLTDNHLDEIALMTHFKQVDLRSNNGITDEGAEKLLNLAKTTKIDLDSSRISADVREKLKTTYESNHRKH